MSEIININDLGPLPSVSRQFREPSGCRSTADRLTGDTAEFSVRGTALARAMEESSLRIARTRAIREEIANGTFETPERINETVERLLDVIA